MRLAVLSLAFVTLGFTAGQAEEAEMGRGVGPAAVSWALNARPDRSASGMNLIPAQHTEWDFIGCVHSHSHQDSHHQCRNAAGFRGFPHYNVVRDSRMCYEHPHIACYGGHH